MAGEKRRDATRQVGQEDFNKQLFICIERSPGRIKESQDRVGRLEERFLKAIRLSVENKETTLDKSGAPS